MPEPQRDKMSSAGIFVRAPTSISQIPFRFLSLQIFIDKRVTVMYQLSINPQAGGKKHESAL